MASRYCQVSLEERGKLETLAREGHRRKAIAKSLRREQSTISREMSRNREGDLRASAQAAAERLGTVQGALGGRLELEADRRAGGTGRVRGGERDVALRVDPGGSGERWDAVSAAARQAARGQEGCRRGGRRADPGARRHWLAVASSGREVADRRSGSRPGHRQRASRVGADGGGPEEQARVAGGFDGQDVGDAGADPAAGAVQESRRDDHDAQRQGIHGPHRSGRGTGAAVLLRTSVPLVGARAERPTGRRGSTGRTTGLGSCWSTVRRPRCCKPGKG